MLWLKVTPVNKSIKEPVQKQKRQGSTSPFLIFYKMNWGYTEKLVPQPQVLAALGLLKTKPRAFNPC